MGEGAGGIAEEGEIYGLTRFPAKRKDGRGAGVGADVEAVVRLVAALVSGLANSDPVVSILRRDEGDERVGFEERGVIAIGEFKVVGSEDCQMGVEERVAEAHGFGFHGEALALFQGDDVAVHILGLDDAVDGGVELDPLSLPGGVVGLGL